MVVLSLAGQKRMHGKGCEKLYVLNKEERTFMLRSHCLLHGLIAGAGDGCRNFGKDFEIGCLFCRGVSINLKCASGMELLIYFQTILHAPVPMLWHCARPEKSRFGCKGKVKHDKQRNDLNVEELYLVPFCAGVRKVSCVDLGGANWVWVNLSK